MQKSGFLVHGALLLACISSATLMAGQQTPSATIPVIVSTTHSQDSRGEVVYDKRDEAQKDAPVVPGVLVDPIFIKQVRPKATFSSRLYHRKLTILVQGVVTASGDVIDVELLKDGGDAPLARNVLDAFGHFKFKPATLDGKPVAVLVQVPFLF